MYFILPHTSPVIVTYLLPLPFLVRFFFPLSIYIPIFLSLSSTCAHAKYISSLEPSAVLSETDDLLLTCSHQSLIS